MHLQFSHGDLSRCISQNAWEPKVKTSKKQKQIQTKSGLDGSVTHKARRPHKDCRPPSRLEGSEAEKDVDGGELTRSR